MLHPLFATIIHRPDLVVDHLSAYGTLLRLEASSASSELLMRGVGWVLALFAGVIFLGLAGIAIMLGFVNGHFHWVLVIVPGVPLVISAIAFAIANKPVRSEYFKEIKTQIKSDAQALQAAI